MSQAIIRRRRSKRSTNTPMTEENSSDGMILAIMMPATANEEPPVSVVTSGIRRPITSQSPTPLMNWEIHSALNRRLRSTAEYGTFACGSRPGVFRGVILRDLHPHGAHRRATQIHGDRKGGNVARRGQHSDAKRRGGAAQTGRPDAQRVDSLEYPGLQHCCFRSRCGGFKGP